jgi:hypothetical protein
MEIPGEVVGVSDLTYSTPLGYRPLTRDHCIPPKNADDGVAEGLARDRAPMRAAAADRVEPLDDGDLLAMLDGLHGGPFAAGPAADHENIEMLRVRHGRNVPLAPPLVFDPEAQTRRAAGG